MFYREQKGCLEGSEENIIQIVKKIYKNGVFLEKFSKFTGLSIEEIEIILNNN